MRLVLTGFMGTGKTEVGRRIAARLGRTFVDTDAAIEAEAGRSIPEIFTQEGEAAFRERERRAVRAATEIPDAVISVGGGALLAAENRAALERDALVVCLTATAEAIAERVGPNPADRPLLAGATSVTDRVRALLAERAPVYAQVRERVDTSAATPEEVAEEVIRRLERAEGGA